MGNMTVVEAGAVPIVEDKVIAFGGCVENDGMISWVPADAPGFVPLNCYLLVEGRAGMLVDTGLPVLELQVIEQARRFDLDSVTIALTRFGEFDSVGNAEMLERVLPIDACYALFPPRDYLYMRGDAQPPPASYAFRVFPDDGIMDIGSTRPLTVLNTRLKLLPTAWIYDHATKTLFSSDAFSHVLTDDPGTRTVTDEDDRTTPDGVLRHMLLKWDWLAGADTAPIRAYVDEVFSTYEVETIAPSYGCILMGSALVRRHVEMLDDALLEVGA